MAKILIEIAPLTGEALREILGDHIDYLVAKVDTQDVPPLEKSILDRKMHQCRNLIVSLREAEHDRILATE